MLLARDSVHLLRGDAGLRGRLEHVECLDDDAAGARHRLELARQDFWTLTRAPRPRRAARGTRRPSAGCRPPGSSAPGCGSTRSAGTSARRTAWSRRATTDSWSSSRCTRAAPQASQTPGCFGGSFSRWYVAWQLGHQRRPDSRSISTSRGTSKSNTTQPRGSPPVILSSPCAWPQRAREAVEHEAAGAVRRLGPLAHELDQHVVGDEVPLLHHRVGLSPDRRVPGDRVAQHLAGPDLRHARGAPRAAPPACPSLPREGRGRSRGRASAALRALAAATNPLASLAREAVVVTHDELRLDLRHGVHRHADHDQQRGAAEVEVEVQALRDPAQVVVREERVEGAGRSAGCGATLKPVIRNSGRIATSAR